MPQLEFRKFPKIRRFPEEEKIQHKSKLPSVVDNIKSGQPFDITEKLDGANTGIELVNNNGTISYQLFKHTSYITKDFENGFNGFYDYMESNIVPKLTEFMLDHPEGHFYFYGEWLTQHKVIYKPDIYDYWYLFSIYDANSNYEYTLPERLEFAKQYELKTPPVFYDSTNPNANLDFIEKFVGKSNSSKDLNQGEGVVIESNGIRAKIVSKDFAEIKHVTPKKNKKLTPSQRFIEETATKARARKKLFELQENGQLKPDNIDFKHFGDIARPLIDLLWDDILEEESDNRPENFDEKEAKKYLKKKVPTFVKEFINSQESNGFNF